MTKITMTPNRVQVNLKKSYLIHKWNKITHKSIKYTEIKNLFSLIPASFHTRSPLKQSDSKRLGAVRTTNVSDPALSACVDVYLCDTCDKDFDSLEELLQHEKRHVGKIRLFFLFFTILLWSLSRLSRCGNREIISPSSKYPSQDQSNHDRYFQYLKLFKSGSVPASSSRKIKESERPRAASYAKFMDIDVASPLGSYIVNSSGLG